MTPLLDIADLRFGYGSGADILQISQLRLARGEKVFLHGPSGCGKSTLLSLVAGVHAPRSGQLRVLGQELSQLSDAARDRFRGEHLGYIFQSFNLIPYLSVAENIALPCRISAQRRARLKDSLDASVKALCHALGLDGLLGRSVLELSVGQQQRVAAARALLGMPELVIADEPTSSLDSEHRERFIRLLFAECERAGSTLLFVSHDRSLAPLFSREVSLPQLNRAARTPELF